MAVKTALLAWSVPSELAQLLQEVGTFQFTTFSHRWQQKLTAVGNGGEWWWC